MKRGKPLKRSQLKPGKALQRKASLKPYSGLLARARSRPAKKPPVGPLQPGEWRTAVWFADKGLCVGCGARLPVDGNLFVWQAHHCVEKQHLEPGVRYDLRNGIIACADCHANHHSTRKIPAEKLPQRVFDFANEHGFQARLNRAHPHEGEPHAG